MFARKLELLAFTLLILCPVTGRGEERCVLAGAGESFLPCSGCINHTLQKPWRVLVYRYDEEAAKYSYLGPIDYVSRDAAVRSIASSAAAMERDQSFFYTGRRSLRYDGPFPTCPTHGDASLSLEPPPVRSLAARWEEAARKIRTLIERCQRNEAHRNVEAFPELEERLRFLRSTLARAQSEELEAILEELRLISADIDQSSS